MLQVGSAAIDVTPPVGSRLLGHFFDRIAETIHDPICIRALVIDDGTTRVALVGCDVLSLKRPTVVRARELAAARMGIPPEHILISGTHTHNGPATANIFTRPADGEYVALLARQLAGAIALADRAKQPAEIGIGCGWEDSASHNRRFLRKDGTAETHPPKGDPEFVGPEGPDDPEVGVLFGRASDGRPLGTLVNYTSHPILVIGENAFSADFPGQVCRSIKAVKGEPGEVVFVNGAFANVCPIDLYNLKHREYGWDWVERVGNVIAGEALRVIEKTDPVKELRLGAATRQIDLQVREVTDAQVAEARALLARGELQHRPDMSTEEWTAYREQIYAGDILLLAEERRRLPAVAAEVQVIAVGDAAFVGIPGELFVEFGLEIKRRSPFRYTYIAGMANGCVGYIPTRRAFQSGGYETRLAQSSKLVPEAGEQLTNVALELLDQAYTKD